MSPNPGSVAAARSANNATPASILGQPAQRRLGVGLRKRQRDTEYRSANAEGLAGLLPRSAGRQALSSVSANFAAASTTCSQLSSTSSSLRYRTSISTSSAVRSARRAVGSAATTSIRQDALRSSPSSTSRTPSGKSAATRPRAAPVGFAHPADPGRGHQTRCRQEGLHLGQLRGAPTKLFSSSGMLLSVPAGTDSSGCWWHRSIQFPFRTGGHLVDGELVAFRAC